MILVTGGTGLVGTHLLFQLLKQGLTVRAIHRTDSDLDKVAEIFSYYESDSKKYFEKIDWVVADINDIPALEDAFRGVNKVYHCAAYISFDPAEFKKLQKINEEGTTNIVNLCIAKKIDKLCYVSTIGAIGKSLEGAITTEENEWNDSNANVYAKTKYQAEMEVWRASEEGVPVVIVNPGIILGPGFWFSGSGSLFRIAARGPRFYLPGGSGFVTVNDVVRIMMQLMQSDIKGHRFIVIDKNLTYKEIVSNIAREFGKSTPKVALKFWHLELLWRLDWLRCKLTGQKRKLTKNNVVSFRNPETYSNKKLKEMLGFEFELMPQTVYFSCNRYKEAFPERFI